jgi:hypothetical protein
MKIAGLWTHYWAAALAAVLVWAVTAGLSNTLGVRIFAPLFLFLIICLFPVFVSSLRECARASRWNKYFLIGQLVFWTLFLAMMYPGLYSYDSFVSVNGAALGFLSAWQSFIYSMLCATFAWLDASLFGLVCFQVLLYLGLFIFVLRERPLQNGVGLIAVSGLAILPLVQFTVIFINRDVMFGLFTCWMILPLWSKKKLQASDMCYFCLMLFLTSGLRQDAKMYLVAFPLALLVWQGRKMGKLAGYSVLTGLFALMISFVWSLREEPDYFQSYELTAIYHPLHYVTQQRFETFTDDERTVLGRVVPLDQLRASYDPYYINLFHQGYYTLPVSPDHWKQFRKTYVSLMIKNKDLFLRERGMMNLTMFNIIPRAYISSDSFDKDDPFYEKIRNDLKLSRNSWFNGPRLYYQNIKNQAALHNWGNLLAPFIIICVVGALALAYVWWMGALGSSVFWVLAWLWICPLLYWVADFVRVYKSRELRNFFLMAAFVIFSRFPVVFLGAPEPHITYWAPAIYFPILFFVLTTSEKARVKKISRGPRSI